MKMASKNVCNKPFYLVDRKSGPKNSVTDTDICQFISVLEANIRLNDGWKGVMRLEWKPKSVNNRGFQDAEAAAKCLLMS